MKERQPLTPSITTSMRYIVSIVLLFVFSNTICGQEIGFGKYRLCYDMYWRCHFQNLIELRFDSTYTFMFLDDVQVKTTTGFWKIDSNFVVLTPSYIPDTLQITEQFETSNQEYSQNEISISQSFNRIPNLDVMCFQNGDTVRLKTDTIGEIHYKGDVFDSLVFTFNGRELKVIPKKKVTPSLIRITIDTDCLDLVFEQLGTNRILIQNGKMLIRYLDEDDGKLKTEYFEKIE